MPVLMLQLQKGGKASLRVTGSSMFPMLQHLRDSVVLEPLGTPLKGGDLILYRRREGAYVLHRIVRCCADGTYICCGDNQWEKEQVAQDQVIARVCSFIRKGRTHLVNAGAYRFYVWFWVHTFPVRRPLVYACRLMARIRSVIKRK